MAVETDGELDGLIGDLQRALARCDAMGVGLSASMHVDLALHFALRERDGLRTAAAALQEDGLENAAD